MKKIALLAAGVVGALLGGLWLLQGLGLVQIEPILCVANCETVQGPSLMWAIVGFCVFAAGLAGIYFALKRRAPRQ